MREELEFIREFGERFHQADPSSPTAEIDPRYRDHRIKLMVEELDELIKGMRNSDLSNIAKEAADLLYVLLGTMSAYGLLEKFPEVFRAVHESNMTKTYIEGKGKPAKLDNYREPDVEKILES